MCVWTGDTYICAIVQCCSSVVVYCLCVYLVLGYMSICACVCLCLSHCLASSWCAPLPSLPSLLSLVKQILDRFEYLCQNRNETEKKKKQPHTLNRGLIKCHHIINTLQLNNFNANRNKKTIIRLYFSFWFVFVFSVTAINSNVHRLNNSKYPEHKWCTHTHTSSRSPVPIGANHKIRSCLSWEIEFHEWATEAHSCAHKTQ